ncbi:hypothetical protein V6N12_046986 [Hibiscus sabdariffa]|uniref:F-box domain-containing protein n=1 Tax=Hibiscus sabdariffa TaxID=183260 RepID=A0ABR2BC80_9ROSI
MWKNDDSMERTTQGRDIAVLSDDLVIEVLCRLPPKTLMRCCCVCKDWYSLIMSCCVPRITPSLPFLGCQVRIRTWWDSVFDGALIPQAEAAGIADAWPPMFNVDKGFMVYIRHSPFYLLDSSNGLMLFLSLSKLNYVLWNPTTKQFLSFPYPNNNRDVFAFLAVGVKHVRIVAFPRIEALYDNVNVICDSVKLPGSDHNSIGKGRRDKKRWCIGSSEGRLQFAQKDPGLGLVQIWVFSFDTREWNLVHRFSLQALAKHPQLVDARALFRVVNPKFKLLTFDPVPDDGMIIWTPNLIFCYYWKSGKLIPLQWPSNLNEALEHPPVDAFPFTQWIAPLVLSCSNHEKDRSRSQPGGLLRYFETDGIFDFGSGTNASSDLKGLEGRSGG